jgi:hypothetical protein
VAGASRASLLPAVALASAAPRLLAGGDSNLQLTTPLIWAMVAISAAGAIVTFAFLVYAVVKFRDPATKGRRYG